MLCHIEVQKEILNEIQPRFQRYRIEYIFFIGQLCTRILKIELASTVSPSRSNNMKKRKSTYIHSVKL